MPPNSKIKSKKGESKKGDHLKVKRRRKPNNKNFSRFIFRLFKDMYPDGDMSLSKNSMSIMNSFVVDIFERLASEAGNVAKYNKSKTIKISEFATAVKLVVGGEIAELAHDEGLRALKNYQDSIEGKE